MKAIQIAAPGGLDQLRVVNMPYSAATGPGEIQVSVNAS